MTELFKHKELKSFSFRPARNWVKLADYCRDEKKRIPNGIVKSKGIPKPIKILDQSKLYDWEIEIENIVKGEPHDRKIYWYYETTGNIGKTTFCKYLVVKHKALILGGKAKDMKYGIVKYIEKTGEYPKNIVIDIPRTSKKFLSYQGLEEVKNACFFSGKYEGSMVVGNCPNLIIFANFKPNKSKMSLDRWIVKCLGDDDSLSSESE